MSQEIPKHYDFKKYEKKVYQRLIDSDAFAALPDSREDTYVIMMPLPNVTGALHMGHAMDNVMQDLLIAMAPHDGGQHALDAGNRSRRDRHPGGCGKASFRAGRQNPA